MPAVCHYCEEDEINEACCEKSCRLCMSVCAGRQESYSVLGDTTACMSTCFIFTVALWVYYVRGRGWGGTERPTSHSNPPASSYRTCNMNFGAKRAKQPYKAQRYRDDVTMKFEFYFQCSVV
jgi:hypothetical protein